MRITGILLLSNLQAGNESQHLPNYLQISRKDHLFTSPTLTTSQQKRGNNVNLLSLCKFFSPALSEVSFKISSMMKTPESHFKLFPSNDLNSHFRKTPLQQLRAGSLFSASLALPPQKPCLFLFDIACYKVFPLVSGWGYKGAIPSDSLFYIVTTIIIAYCC